MSAQTRVQNVMVIALVAALGSAVGCGSSSSGSATAKACDTTESGLHICIEVEGAAASCKSPGVALDACPTTDAIGDCTTTASKIQTVVTYYSTDGMTAAEAQATCEGDSGTWLAK